MLDDTEQQIQRQIDKAIAAEDNDRALELLANLREYQRHYKVGTCE